MTKWLRRIRGAIGTGLTWAVAWGGAGTIVMWTESERVYALRGTLGPEDMMQVAESVH